MKGCIAGLCVMLLVACSPEPSGTAAAPAETAPTTRPPHSDAFINGGRCPSAAAAELPSDAGCATTAGDLMVYARVDGAGEPISWHTRLRGLDQRLKAGNAFSYPRAIAELDLVGDDDPEWLIKTFDLASHGTNWQQLGLFVLSHRGLVQVTHEGEAFPIRVGGISRMGEGARCVDGGLSILRTEAENRINTRWSTSETHYRIEGASAFRGEREAGMLRLRGYNDPKLDPFYRIGCGGFTYP